MLGELIDREQKFIIKEDAYQTKKVMFTALGEKEDGKNETKGDHPKNES